MDLTIIIVNWNSAHYLRACLQSVYAGSQGIEFEVIVVDNASHDGCTEIIRDKFPAVKLVESTTNLGFARANNLGYAYAQASTLLFLNPDTEIIGDALSRMVAHLAANSSVGAVGARLLNSDGSLQTSSVQAFPTIWNQLLDFDVLRRLFPRWGMWGMSALVDGQPPDAEAISGACFMVKRSVFERAGQFCEEYFMYADDLDLSHNIQRAGYAIHCLNECRVMHHGGKSSEQQSDHFADVLQRESLARFFLKTHGRAYAGAYRVAMTGIALIRLILVAALAPFTSFGVEGKSARPVLRKWSQILRWSLGLERWTGAAGTHP